MVVRAPTAVGIGSKASPRDDVCGAHLQPSVKLCAVCAHHTMVGPHALWTKGWQGNNLMKMSALWHNKPVG